jgi:tRNA modification GTPase
MNRQIRVNKSQDQQTVVALCTPQGSGALALVRLCGQDVFEVVNKFAKLSGDKILLEQQTHTICHGFVVDPGGAPDKIIDEVLFFLMRGPKTFTGQDTIEISCHNNQFIVEKVIQIACKFGARLACPGEFSRRAVLNDKINLIQAEAINDLIHAQNELALKKSMEQLHGSLSHFLLGLETDLVRLLAFVEASFEFIEEETKDIDLNEQIKIYSSNIIKKLSEIKVNFNQQKQIRQGIKIALLGSVNVGKSTLFNALLNQERAIVSEIEGTTRDSIESTIYKDGIFWTFIDTAGLRQSEDCIEKQGIERSLMQAQDSDLLLLVFDASQDLSEDQECRYKEIIDLYTKKVIFVVNKIDQVGFDKNKFIKFLKNGEDVVAISAKERSGVLDLLHVIAVKIKEIFSNGQSLFLLNQRQARLINEIELKIEFIVKNQLDTLEYELVAYQLKEILELMSELTGKNVNERVLDSVFNEFCVGK